MVEIAKDTAQNPDSTAEEDEVDFTKASELEGTEEKIKYKLLHSKKIDAQLYEAGDVLELSEADFENSRKLAVLRRENELIPLNEKILWKLKKGTTIKEDFVKSGSVLELSEKEIENNSNLQRLKESGDLYPLSSGKEIVKDVEKLKDSYREKLEELEKTEEEMRGKMKEIEEDETTQLSPSDLDLDRYVEAERDINLTEEERTFPFRCSHCGYEWETSSEKRWISCPDCRSSTRREEGILDKLTLTGELVQFLRDGVKKVSSVSDEEELIYDAVSFFLSERG
ncbi:MAG: hypothetical protein ACLFVL_00365 [Candidatus Aenigmatarchaeota archaeon]